MDRVFLSTVAPLVLSGAAVAGGWCKGERWGEADSWACFLAASRRVICREERRQCGLRPLVGVAYSSQGLGFELVLSEGRVTVVRPITVVLLTGGGGGGGTGELDTD